MDTIQFNLDKTGCFSQLIEDYVNDKENVHQFVKYPFEFGAFEQIIKDKQNTYRTDRGLLTTVIQEQYQQHPTSRAVQDNIDLLKKDNTFTITTAHQPILFTGPLFFIYKVMGAVNTAQMLNEQYSDFNFVPIYWMGSEDHDFAEVNHTFIWGNRVEWQGEQGAAVGRMDTDNFLQAIEDLKEILQDKDGRAGEIIELFTKAYTQFNRFDEATHYIVEQLFGRFGVVMITGDDPRLKSLFKEVIQDEIFHERVEQLTAPVRQKIDDLYKVQANPREINIFYLTEGSRDRIVSIDDDTFQTASGAYTFSREELLEEIDHHPERFSPNVMLRPLYQETLLPNLAYVGGGGELSYWMEQKPIFDHYGINYPMLILRDSVMWLDKGSQKKLNKLWLKEEDLFKDEELLVKNYVEKHAGDDISLEKEKKDLEDIYNRVLSQAEGIDVTLKKTVKAEQQKQINALEKLEGKLLKAEKRKYDEAISQIRNIKRKLFPNGDLQERVENFIPFYIKHGDDFFTILHQHLNPFNKKFLILKG